MLQTELIHARTLSPTPAPCGFFIAHNFPRYPPQPTGAGSKFFRVTTDVQGTY